MLVARCAAASTHRTADLMRGLFRCLSKQLKKALGGRSASQLAHAVHDAQAAWSRWAVGLQWLVLAAEELGLQSIGKPRLGGMGGWLAEHPGCV